MIIRVLLHWNEMFGRTNLQTVKERALIISVECEKVLFETIAVTFNLYSPSSSFTVFWMVADVVLTIGSFRTLFHDEPLFLLITSTIVRVSSSLEQMVPQSGVFQIISMLRCSSVSKVISSPSSGSLSILSGVGSVMSHLSTEIVLVLSPHRLGDLLMHALTVHLYRPLRSTTFMSH